MIDMKKTYKLSAAFLIVALVGALTMFSSAKAERVAEPPFTLVMREGAFEIRDYQAQVVAEVSVNGTMGEASNRGFSPLAGYIFGGNAPRAKIAMTAPVVRQQGTKIAMTAPVTRQATGPRSGDSWHVRFIMPAGSTLATLPAPNNPNVRLLEEPSKRYGVIRFSGLGGAGTFESKASELAGILAARRLVPIGAPIFASYDPPWTLPFMRRHEVWLELTRP
jgi:hypothetical protein